MNKRIGGGFGNLLLGETALIPSVSCGPVGERKRTDLSDWDDALKVDPKTVKKKSSHSPKAPRRERKRDRFLDERGR